MHNRRCPIVLFFMHNSNISSFISHNLLRAERQVFILFQSQVRVYNNLSIRGHISSLRIDIHSWFSDAQKWSASLLFVSILQYCHGVWMDPGFFSIWGEVAPLAPAIKTKSLDGYLMERVNLN